MTVENCTNTGTVANSGTSCRTGGVVGYNRGKVSNCSNTGNVSNSSSGAYYTGGVVGRNSSGTVSNCYNIGSVSGGTNNGGVAGKNESGCSVINCYYLEGLANAAIGIDNGTSTSVAVKTNTVFASGEVAYLLNGSISGGTTWYQNLDNGKTVDSYPVLSSSNGTVYYGTNCVGTAIYSNSTVPAATHILTHVEAQGAICTADGNKEYWYCTECGETYTEVIPATGSTVSDDSNSTENTATETSADSETTSTETSSSGSVTSPETGDSGSLYLWLFIVIISGCGFAYIAAIRIKKFIK